VTGAIQIAGNRLKKRMIEETDVPGGLRWRSKQDNLIASAARNSSTHFLTLAI
jgi:hypothetical protein